MILTYHRNDVDFVAQSSHELKVELFELVTVGSDEVEAGMNPDDGDGDGDGDEDDSNDNDNDNDNVSEATLCQQELFCWLEFQPQGICQTAPLRSMILDTWQIIIVIISFDHHFQKAPACRVV